MGKQMNTACLVCVHMYLLAPRGWRKAIVSFDLTFMPLK